MSGNKSLTLAQEPTLQRDEKGRFIKGQTGNSRGRPLGRKNQLTKLKQELELAVRENLDPKALRKILNAIAEKAMQGDVSAAKLILDKTISNATDSEEQQETSGSFVFKVKNLTIKSDEEREVIDVTPKEIE